MITYFSDDYFDYSREDAISCLKDNDFAEDEITDDVIENQIYQMIEWSCDDLKSSIQSWDKEHNGRVLVVGSCGLWNGRHRGGKIYRSLEDAVYNLTQDINKLYADRTNTTLKMSASHHDGTNHFTFYELTDKGMQYENNHYDSMSDEKLHNNLLNNRKYIRKIILEDL